MCNTTQQVLIAAKVRAQQRAVTLLAALAVPAPLRCVTVVCTLLALYLTCLQRPPPRQISSVCCSARSEGQRAHEFIQARNREHVGCYCECAA
jgi:hypothetical protein